MTVHVFAGPTLGHDEVHRHLDGAVVHGPVKLGDLLRLRAGEGDVVLVIDGLFHQEPAVRHKEILDVMAAGATVAGASSMGALRAAEMYRYGMIGIGSVFEMYRDGVIDADDEVAVTHAPPPDWRLLSEALVNVRHAVGLCVTDGTIPAEHAERIVELAKSLPYPLRKWPVLEAESVSLGGGLHRSVAVVRRFVETSPSAGDLKRQDALLALDVVAQGRLGLVESTPELDWKSKDDWRTMHLARWLAQFRGPSVSASPGSGLAVFNYQQIYDLDFPLRWERHVLSRVARSGTARADLPLRERALAAAALPERGLELLTADRTAEWLTPEELASRDEEELVVRVLVRSSSKSPDFPRTPFDAEGLLVDLPRTEQAVAESFVINREVAGVNHTKHIDNLKTTRLKTHLGTVWGVEVDDRHLTAAARDRGFISVDEAVAAVRPFYLRHAAHAARLVDKVLLREDRSAAHG